MPNAWVLDLSRLASRVGRRPLSGIDRVELAWARRFLRMDEQALGLIRTRLGYILIGRAGIEIISDAAEATGASGRDLMTALRQARVGRCSKVGLARMLVRKLPAGTIYLNVGHSNVTPRVFKAFGRVPNTTRILMIHDVIPLTHHLTQSPEAAEKMARILRVADGFADVLAFPTKATAQEVDKRILGPNGQRRITARLGPGLPNCAGIDPVQPANFVMIGTIEPRKNHELIAQIWEGFIADPPPAGIPRLTIFGKSGWAPAKLHQRVADLVAQGVAEHVENADDSTVAEALAGSSGLLFPSLAEGFGLPVLEAAQQGIPCICAPLPAFHEVVGDIPVYADPSDPYSWRQTIIELMDKDKQRAERERIGALVAKQALPTWEDHFNIILSAVD